MHVYRYVPSSDDCIGDLNTNCDVTVGVPVNGSFQGDYDNDWYRVTFDAGELYEVRMVPDETEHAAAAAWINGIYNSDGEFLSNDGSVVQYQASGFAYHTAASGILAIDNVARTTVMATSGGVYYIALGSWGGIGDREGHYTLEVEETDSTFLNGDDYPPGRTIGGIFVHGTETGWVGPQGSISVGRSVTGYIERDRDRDWFAVELVAGTQYRAVMTGITLHDPQIGGVRSDMGGFVHGAPVNDINVMRSLNSRLDFSVTTSGTCFIEATTPASKVSFNNIGQYRLSIKVIS